MLVFGGKEIEEMKHKLCGAFMAILMFFMTSCGNENTVVNVYYPNDDITGFDVETAELAVLSPENILNCLIQKGVLNEQVQINSFETVLVEEKDSIEIDFSQEFLTSLSNTGSTGEYYVIGSICNTYLDAYDCEQIKITVSDEILSTGHAEYSKYMGVFQ